MTVKIRHKQGAVAAGHPATAQSAIETLKAGGNAFDAALAAMVSACVAEPALASLGGGGFLLAQPAAGKSCLYDFFVQTPKHRRREDEAQFKTVMVDFGSAQQAFHIGAGAIATPGVVKGLFEAHKDLGQLPLTEVLAPAMDLAKSGVKVNTLQAYVYRILSDIFHDTLLASETFCLPGTQTLPVEGEWQRFPAMADFMDCLAHEGDALFYRGEISQSAAELCERDGGHLTRDDFESYQVIKRQPLQTELGHYVISTNPPPSLGGILISFALRLLKQHDPKKMQFGSLEHLSLLTRLMTLSDEARVRHCMSPDKLHAPMQLLDPQLLQQFAEQIQHRPAARRGTTHISVIDGEGNAASLTASNGEGCGVVLPNSGFMLNNMLGEEDLYDNDFPHWRRDIRMSSMMAPSLLRNQHNGDLFALGSGGSNRIRSAILQSLINIVLFDQDIETAVTSPRIHVENNFLNVEPGFEATHLIDAQQQVKSHKQWEQQNMFFGGVHAVHCHQGQFYGAGDLRRDGCFLRT